MKMCGKGEMWSLHYHHDGNVMRDQVTPKVPVLLFYYHYYYYYYYYYLFIYLFKDSAGRLKKLLLGLV